MKRYVLILSLCSILGLAVSAVVLARPSTSSTSAAADFDKLVDDYFAFSFRFNPTSATAAGFHQYDDKLEDYSASAVNAEITGLTKLQARFDAFPKSQLSENAAGDFDFLVGNIRSSLLELQDIQSWRKDPDTYSSGVTNSIFLVMKRNFAPQEERLWSVIERERQIPAALEAARRNLKNPPRVFTEVALEQLPGSIDFFRRDVPAAFPEVKDAKLRAAFNVSNGTAVEALKKYQAFLRKEVLPASSGDFRIGAENFRKKLLYEEMVDIPLERLLEIGHADLRGNQQRLKEVAARINPAQTPSDVLSTLEKDHPAPGQLLQAFRDSLGSLRQFIEQKKIITIPSLAPPVVEESPPFMRALSSASMDTPGAYETKATEAMFNVTLPGPNWTRKKTEDWMESFNRGTIISTATHEVYPGHYVQFLWIQNAPSKTRKLLFSSSNAEGWAHYCEQMMLDEGYGNGDPQLRMGQLQDALLRDARFIAGIEMHTGKMTLEQGKEFFIKEGYQLPPVAEEEARRGTSDPTYLVYTLGKLQILKLREDYRKLQGDKFTLREFHDQFMQQGGVPLKIIRKAMLADDSPTL
jgi:uncharacterized protein (DUF885 family)